MMYHSTRGNGGSVTASAAIVKGLADDGGLYVPDSIPRLADLESLIPMSYQERAAKILGMFLTDFTEEEIKSCVSKAYTKEKFESEQIAPLHKLNDIEYVLELWHGPTCAFKDMALQILPHLLTVSMDKNGISEDVTILVATSGDTGKAALEGFRDVDGTKIIVFFPRDGVSKIQKLQMVTQEGKNVGVCSVAGNFDDAQTGVKAIFCDEEYNDYLKKNNLVLSSANSINWGRLAPQIAYYFSAWADMRKSGAIKEGDKINIVVPTGNFGNILAAYYAYCMGLPVNKFVCASNSNNVLTDFINTGTYSRIREFQTTISPSMDILISSNLERFLYHLAGEDTDKIKKWMSELKEEGAYTVDGETKNKINELMWAGCCGDEDTLKTIKETSDKYTYVPDTHTAVALGVYDKYLKETGDTSKTVIASTASPYKFGGSVLAALGVKGISDDFEILNVLWEKSGLAIPESLRSLQGKAIRFDKVVEPKGMKEAVSGLLGI